MTIAIVKNGDFMELFSASQSGRPLLLSASDTGLSFHPMQNERFGHPILLCSNYKNGLSGCIYNKTLYYVYTNKDNALLVRRLHESGVLFRLDSTGTVTYSNPQPIVFDNTLFLFYIEEEANSYRLKLRQLFPDTELTLPDSLRISFPVPPLFCLSATEHYLYLTLTAGATDLSFRYSPHTSFESLHSEEEVLSQLRLPWDAEKAQLEQTILQAIHLSEQQQTLLTEKEQTLKRFETRISELTAETEQTNALLSETTLALQTTKAQLADCERNSQQTEQKLERTTLLLERAKSQYNELMQVAEQYRQEALKWYGKFTDRN